MQRTVLVKCSRMSKTTALKWMLKWSWVDFLQVLLTISFTSNHKEHIYIHDKGQQTFTWYDFRLCFWFVLKFTFNFIVNIDINDNAALCCYTAKGLYATYTIYTLPVLLISQPKGIWKTFYYTMCVCVQTITSNCMSLLIERFWAIHVLKEDLHM